MILIHRTGPESAADILKNGFVDGPAYTELADIAGVFLSDRPLDSNESANGGVLLEVQIGLHEADLADFELVEDDKPYREWCVPAALVNRAAACRIVDSDED